MSKKSVFPLFCHIIIITIFHCILCPYSLMLSPCLNAGQTIILKAYFVMFWSQFFFPIFLSCSMLNLFWNHSMSRGCLLILQKQLGIVLGISQASFQFYFPIQQLSCGVSAWQTDYRHPMKPFFIEIPNFWAWADKLGD